jgi:hypothetical protein
MDQMNETQDNRTPLNLPNATSSLVLGILSISMCYCWGPIGLILAIIGLSMGNKATGTYKSNPGAYAAVSYNNANAGKICSIIGLILSALALVWTIAQWSFMYNMIKEALDGAIQGL